MMKALAGKLAFVLLGALLALGVVAGAGLGPGRYTLYRNGAVRLDRWTGEVAYTSELARQTGDRLAACQRDAAAWRSTALYWEHEAARRTTSHVVNPFRERARARASAEDSTRLDRLRAAVAGKEPRTQ